MVTVLPWHDPVRVVESFSVLVNSPEGRAKILGIRPGSRPGRVNGFGGRRWVVASAVTEYTEAILEALETGYSSPERRSILSRHAPRSDRARAAASRAGPFASAVLAESMGADGRWGRVNG